MTKYMDRIKMHFGTPDYPVFTLVDLRVFLNDTDISDMYLKILINGLIKKGSIIRISRGVYTFHKEIAVVGFAFRPFYYGLEDALSYRNLWNQASNPIVITHSGVREGMRKFEGGNYMVKRIRHDLFFGFDFIKYYDFWLPVSDPEKTLIDLVYYHHGIRDDALVKLLDILNREKLDEYLKGYGRGFRKKINRIISTSPKV